MRQGIDVDRFVKDPSLLVELSREVLDRFDAVEYNTEATVERTAMEAQLREIAKAVEKLEKLGVPVLDALRAEKTRLAAALGVKDEKTQALTILAEAFGEILREIRARLQQRQPQPLDGKMRPARFREDRLPRIALREAIISALKGFGGRASRKNVYTEMARQLESQFLPGDLKWLDTRNGYSWNVAATQEQRKMVKEGILRSDSPIGIWELSEVRR